MYITEVAETLKFKIPKGTEECRTGKVYKRNASRRVLGDVPMWLVINGKEKRWEYILDVRNKRTSSSDAPSPHFPIYYGTSGTYEPTILGASDVSLENFLTIPFLRSMSNRKSSTTLTPNKVLDWAPDIVSDLLTLIAAYRALVPVGHKDYNPGYEEYATSLLSRESSRNVSINCVSAPSDLYHMFKDNGDLWAILETVYLYNEYSNPAHRKGWIEVVERLNKVHGSDVTLYGRYKAFLV